MKLFYLNRSYSKACVFLVGNLVVFGFLLFVATQNSTSLPHPYLWASFILLLLFLLLYMLISMTSLVVKEVQISEDHIILKFFLFKSRNYNFNELRYYATADFGTGRSGLFHSVVLEFSDGNRYQVAYPIIENYKKFLEFMRNSNFDYYGYIGQNNWRRKSKPLSKKWVVARSQKDLEKDIEKKKGVLILYVYGFSMFAMNLALLRYFIVYH